MKFKPALYIILLIAVLSVQTKAQKIDTIYHINGNVMTGDFKSLNYGVVTWKMDGMGTISFEEPKINTIKSKKQFEIKLKDGLTYFGSFDTSGFDRKVNILMTNGKQLVGIEDIVEVYPIRRSFWLRTSGKFSLGLNYSKGSDVATVTLSGNLLYRKQKSSFNLSWDNNTTYQEDTLNATKTDVAFNWQRLIIDRWSLSTTFGVSQNTQLGTKLRLNLILAGIYDLVYNKWNRVYTGAGLSTQRETPYDTTGITTDLTGVVMVGWKVYKYTSPKVWVDAGVIFVPYFTTASRYRTDITLNPQISIIGNDLKLGFKFYYTYDTNPLAGADSNSDWGINLEISYILH